MPGCPEGLRNDIRQRSRPALSIFLGDRRFLRNRHKQIMPGHLFGLRQTEEKQERGRDIGQNSVFAAKLCRVLRHINEMHKVGGVRRIWRSVWIAHLLAISVVGRDDALAIKIEKF